MMKRRYKKVIIVLLAVILLSAIYMGAMFISSIFTLESQLEDLEAILLQNKYEALKKSFASNSIVKIDEHVYQYANIEREVKNIFLRISKYNIINLQISPDVEQELEIGIFSTNVTLRCFFESTVENTATQVLVKLKLNRTLFFGWKISKITIEYYSDIDWQ